MLDGAWLASTEERPLGRPFLYCFPHVGVGVAPFRTWRAQVPTLAILPIRLPGRETRLGEPVLRTVDAIVDALATAWVANDDETFAFFGHCHGALIAYEFARRLWADKRPLPIHLFVSTAVAPHAIRFDTNAPLVGQMSSAELIQHLRSLGATDELVLQTPQLMELVEPAIRGDFEAAETYRYRESPPLPLPITALAARGELESTKELEAWRIHTDSRFALTLFEGNHILGGGTWNEIPGAIAHALQEGAVITSDAD